jgi:hypothetical protein
LQQRFCGGVDQAEGLVLEEPAGDAGVVVGFEGVDGFQPQLGAAVAVAAGGQVQGGDEQVWQQLAKAATMVVGKCSYAWFTRAPPVSDGRLDCLVLGLYTVG